MIQQPPYATQLLTHLHLNHHQHHILPRRPRVNRIMKMMICYPCDTRPHSHHITAHWIHTQHDDSSDYGTGRFSRADPDLYDVSSEITQRIQDMVSKE